MKKKYILIVIGTVSLSFLLLISMRIIRRRPDWAQRFPRWQQWLEERRKPTPAPEEVSPLDTPGKVVRRIKTLTTNGGRVAWSPKGDLIAFDRKGEDGYFDIWLMKPDGSEQKCLTCDKGGLPSKNIGNPAWHPSGEYLVFQAEDPNLELETRIPKLKKYITSPGIGLNNNLWLMTTNGSLFWQLTQVDNRHGILHPHFSPDGKKLVWSETVQVGSNGLGGHWAIKLADFSILGGAPQLKNIQTLQPYNLQFYETHSFSPDGQKIIYSGIKKGGFHYDFEVYVTELATGETTRLTNNNEWDEHAHFTPDGRQIVWSSSEGNPQPKGSSLQETLKNPPLLDFWIMNADGSNKSRLTFFNDPNAPEYQSVTEGVGVGDCAWSPDGKTIVAKMRSGRGQETIILIELE